MAVVWWIVGGLFALWLLGRFGRTVGSALVGGAIFGGLLWWLFHAPFVTSTLVVAGLLLISHLFEDDKGKTPAKRERRRLRREARRQASLDGAPTPPALPPPPVMLDPPGDPALADSWRKLALLAPDAHNRVAAIRRGCERFLRALPEDRIDLRLIEDAQLVRERLPSLTAATERRIAVSGERDRLVAQLLDDLEDIAATAERATARLVEEGREAHERERQLVATRIAARRLDP